MRNTLSPTRLRLLVVRGNAGYASFTEAVVHDPVIAALRRRVHITEDGQFTAMAPQLKPARVTLILKDGRQASRLCESPRGDYQRPYQESEVRGKFRELAGLVLTREGVSAVERAVDQCDRLSSVRDLIEQIRRHSLP